MNLENTITSSNPVLMAVFVLLLSLSVLSWYIIFLKAWKLRSERKALAAFKAACVKSPDWPLHALPKHAEGGVAVLMSESEKLKPVLASYSQADRREILSMHLAQALDNVRTWLDKGLTVLASTGSSAPFIGLFGTVWGITGALAKIAAAGNAGLNVVAGPMGEALVATAVGLFAAIPAVLAYNAFVRLNRLYVQDLRHIAEQMTVYLCTASLPHKSDVKLLREKN